MNSIDQALDSQRPGSVKVNLSIEGEEFHFQNEFFWVSNLDISSYTSNNLGKILEDIFKNPFQSIKANEIKSLKIYEIIIV